MERRHGRFILYLILIIAAFTAYPLWQRQAQAYNSQQPAKDRQVRRSSEIGQPTPADALVAGFVITRSGEGTRCRQMTNLESTELRAGERLVEMRALSDGRRERLQQQGLKITLRGTPQLEGFSQAKESFLRAAAKWESIIQSPIGIVLDVDYGPTRFGTPYPPSVIGATSAQILIRIDPEEYSRARQALINTAASSQQRAIYNSLPPNELLTDLGPTRNTLGVTPVLRAIGLLNPIADPDAEMALIGVPPSIGFNSAFSYDFDPSNGIDADKIDFEYVALHEIGHALGFVSAMGFNEISPLLPFPFPTIWDFFRFRPGGLNLGSITSVPRVQLTGGEQVFFIGDAEVGLSTSSSLGTGGDGRQGSHWKDDSLTGRYIGVMDPTALMGLRDVITDADLTALNYFGFRINSEAIVSEVLSLDDNTREQGLQLTSALVVNRFTPTRYPSVLQSLRVQIPPTPDGSSPVGLLLRIIAFVDQNRAGQPPANPSLILDRTVNVTPLASLRFIEVMITEPPTITTGDLYVGIQSTSSNLLIAVDSSGTPQSRSFVSTDNGASFQLLRGADERPLNFIARAVLTATLSSTPAPVLAVLSPSAIEPGSPSFTLFVSGKNFQADSVVRWNGSDRLTEFFSGSEIRAQITAADVANAGAANVTVFTLSPGGGESVPLNLNITGDKPVPGLARLNPGTRAIGGGDFILNVFGFNFTPQSVVRWNGQDRPTTPVNSTQLNAAIPGSDLASGGQNRITVFTPGPGGGTSNELNLLISPCSYTLSLSSLTFFSVGQPSGVVVNTDTACSWTASADVPWVTFTNPANRVGEGKYVVNFNIASNTALDARTGIITIGGRQLNIRQAGRATSVSAANFAPRLSPNAIAAVFGRGLAKSTQPAPSQPLPLNIDGTSVEVIDSRGATRAAPLFFVSPNQVNLLIPEGTATGGVVLRILVDGILFADGVVTINTVAPALFSVSADGNGLAAGVILRIKADGTQSFEPIARFDSAQNKFVPIPIDFGAETDQVFLALFGSGIRGRSALGAINVRVGDVDLPAQFAGPQNDFVGLDQVNVLLPRTLGGRGEVTISMTVDGNLANPVNVAFQ